MNWFAIGGGMALVIVGMAGLAGKAGRLPRAAAIALALVGLVFLYLGGALELVR